MYLEITHDGQQGEAILQILPVPTLNECLFVACSIQLHSKHYNHWMLFLETAVLGTLNRHTRWITLQLLFGSKLSKVREHQEKLNNNQDGNIIRVS